MEITPEFRDAVLAVLQEEDTSDAINNIRKRKYTDYDLMRYRQNALTMRFNELDKLHRRTVVVSVIASVSALISSVIAAICRILL